MSGKGNPKYNPFLQQYDITTTIRHYDDNTTTLRRQYDNTTIRRQYDNTTIRQYDITTTLRRHIFQIQFFQVIHVHILDSKLFYYEMIMI